jgi:hypothetical protein
LFLLFELVRVSAVSGNGASRKGRVKPRTVRLKEDLLCGYDKSVRPVIDNGHATVVFVTMSLKTLIFVSSGEAEVFILWDYIVIIIPLYTDVK